MRIPFTRVTCDWCGRSSDLFGEGRLSGWQGPTLSVRESDGTVWSFGAGDVCSPRCMAEYSVAHRPGTPGGGGL